MVAAATLLGVTIISTIGFILTGRYEGTPSNQLIEGLWDTLNLVSTIGNLDELTCFLYQATSTAQHL
ncbi:MAG: hypothetical protein H8E86_04415 [Planctomycetes bacterium]|nr:hypothetical protein [Planctomycetota bacterium]MBL6997036.1 hypothetical protein [Phycisphaerales bacterium]